MRFAFVLLLAVGCRQILDLADPLPPQDASSDGALAADARSDAPPTDGLVASYPLDTVGNGVIADVSGQHDLTCTVCPLGRVDRMGLEFDDGMVASTNLDMLNLPAPVTITGYVTLVHPPENLSAVMVASETFNLQVMSDRTVEAVVDNKLGRSQNQLATNTRAQVALVIEAQRATIYRDGSVDFMIALSGNMAQLVGLSLGAANNQKVGIVLDDMRVYARALAASEIHQLYLQGL